MSPSAEEAPRPSSSSTDPSAAPSRAGADDSVFRRPTAGDGVRMWQIARDSKVLDVNAEYAYALWGAEFAESSVVVESGGRVVGFVTGFRRQDEPDTIFVWQVGVDADQRGRGLAARMLHELMDHSRDHHGCVRLRTTISPDNEASQRTFGAVARDRGMELTRTPYLSAELLGEGHEPEDLYTIA